MIEGFEGTAVFDGYTGLRWSYSRREALDQCPRRYFYQYYCDAINDADFRARVKSLRNVKNRYLRTGDIVHLVISTYFKKLKQGKRLSSQWAASWARGLFADDRRHSLDIRDGKAFPESKYPPSVLDEIVSDVADCNDLLKQAQEQMLLSIAAFFDADIFKEFLELGAMPDSIVEHKISLEGFRVPVTGKIDLAGRGPSLVTVVDWKVGRVSDAGAESLQLAIYGIWATSAFEVSSDQVRIVKAHLGSKEMVEFQASESAFSNARVRIQQDLERMLILHRYGNGGNMSAFTAVAQPRVCRLCPFRQICPEGREVGHA